MALPAGLKVDWLDIGLSLKLGIATSGFWAVAADVRVFELGADANFIRVAILFDRPYADVLALTSDWAGRAGMAVPFPFLAMVRWGFTQQADRWAAAALTWLPHMPLDQRQALALELRALVTAKWAHQGTRQLASRECKRMVAES